MEHHAGFDGDISTHSLLAEGDGRRDGSTRAARHFNPLPPRGGRPLRPTAALSFKKFQPTPSSRRETARLRLSCEALPISTHSLLAEGDDFNFISNPSRSISTHSLLAEGDLLDSGAFTFMMDFNPLPPRGGRRRQNRIRNGGRQISTHSLLAEGDAEKSGHRHDGDISTHSLLAEGDAEKSGHRHDGDISTHSLLAEGDHYDLRGGADLAENFNPLPPRGGRRELAELVASSVNISTHSLLAEGDAIGEAHARRAEGFQPTPSSRRETKIVKAFCWKNFGFQPTPSSRRETPPAWPSPQCRKNFNPLPPRGGRHFFLASNLRSCLISTHSLLAEGDGNAGRRGRGGTGFQPTPSSRRETPFTAQLSVKCRYFNPLPPRGGRPVGLETEQRLKRFQPTPSSRRETR